MPELPAGGRAGRPDRLGQLIGDWVPDDPSSVDVLSAVVKAVHAVGGRVAMHSQHAAGGAAAVAAGVDTLEHGMCLDPDLLS